MPATCYEVTVYAPSTGPVEAQPGHRPVLARPDHQLGAVGAGRPGRPRRSSRPAGTGCASRRCPAPEDSDDLRAARARLLDQRRRPCPAAHRGTYLAFTDRDSDGMRHLRQLAAAGPEHGAPAAGQRHRHDRGAPGEQQQTPNCDLASLPAGQRAAAGLRHRRRRPGRLQLGLRPAALHHPGGLLRHRPGGRRRATGSSAGWSQGSTGPACGW